MPAVASAPSEDSDGHDGHMLSFLSDGASMIIRSTLLQVMQQRRADVHVFLSPLIVVKQECRCWLSPVPVQVR